MNTPALPDGGTTTAPANRAARRARDSDIRRGLYDEADDGLTFINRSEVLRRIPWSPTTLWRMTKKGFPKPIQISPGRVAWMKSQVDDWIRAKMGLADAPTP